MKGFLKKLKFKPEIIDTSGILVNTTLLLYNMVCKEYKPTD